MPTQTRLKLSGPSTSNGDLLPEMLRTQSGTVMLEIQGQINVGAAPLLRTELDSGAPLLEQDGTKRNTPIGELDLSQISETGAPVKLVVAGSQLLRGNIQKLAAPLAVLDVSNGDEPEIPVVDIITHKVVFSKRPEPMLAE